MSFANFWLEVTKNDTNIDMESELPESETKHVPARRKRGSPKIPLTESKSSLQQSNCAWISHPIKWQNIHPYKIVKFQFSFTIQKLF